VYSEFLAWELSNQSRVWCKSKEELRPLAFTKSKSSACVHCVQWAATWLLSEAQAYRLLTIQTFPSMKWLPKPQMTTPLTFTVSPNNPNLQAQDKEA
jgi:hypothetical protein